MKLRSTIVAAALTLLAVPAHAAVTFDYLFDNAYGLAVSYDGSVVTGNTVSDYSAFRWTAAGGLVRLERSAAQMVGHSAGTPGISADGTKIASTIGSPDSAYVTSGRWTLGQGWLQLESMPADSGIGDKDLSSVWGMSGDGRNVVGLYWRYGHGPAHAYRWRQETGVVDLGATARASRANGASYDGSVIAGFDEHPQYGYRRPCAWRNNTLMQLGEYDAIGEAAPVSTTGEWVGGYEKNLDTNTREAALWHWDGSAWSATQYLGSVPGTFPDQGIATARAISADGKLVIGYNSFSGDPFETTGFIWTDSTGCMDIAFWLADKGIEVDPNFDIKSLEAMTPDGKTLIGFGQTTNGPPDTLKTFRIRLDRTPVLAVDPTPANGPASLQLAISPNPMRVESAIHFTLPTSGPVTLTLHDVNGRLVRKLVSTDLAAGPHSLKWDRRNDAGGRVGSGVYFARLQAGTARAAGKFINRD
jgi:uncharacterized membrane protein